MRLSGIDLQGDMRLTQPNDAMDEQLDIMKSGLANIKPDFYTTVFFDLMNGNVTAVDDTSNSIETGIFFKIKDDQDAIISSTPKSKLDWYEDDNYYYIKASVDYNDTLESNVKVAAIDVYYTVNDFSKPVAKDILIVSSTAPSESIFAANGGIIVLQSDGLLTIRCNFLIVIEK